MPTTGFSSFLSAELLAADERRRAWIAEAALDRLARDSRRDPQFAASGLPRPAASRGSLTALATIRTKLAGMLVHVGERLAGEPQGGRATN
ncbi:MAG: hypothetical protein H0U10_17800 [Chloroflexia bacterium]|nr:hypothetical protein [Chloroflexia bacterium]